VSDAGPPEVLAAVNAVLFERWDPLEVRAADARWPRDEYEGYAATVLAELERGSSDDVVAEHLAWIERAWMGLEPPSPLRHRLAAVAALRSAVRAVRRREG
jgi:hypothetical protein